MCDPVTGAITIASSLPYITAASAAVGVYGQQQAVSVQNEANQRQYQNTMKAMSANVNQTNLEHEQMREAANQKLEENNAVARSALATARTSSGENGVSGLSVDALMADIGTKQQRYNTSVDTNYQNSEMALNNQRENIGINAASQINSLKTPAMPDYLTAALRIGDSYTKIKGK